MIRRCKQCGKSFELTDSEIKFYEEKNLSLPKRCKECREANKQAADAAAGGKMVLKPYEPQKNHIPKKYAYLAGLLAVLLLAGILSQSIGIDKESREPVYSAAEAGQTEKSPQTNEYAPETVQSAFSEAAPGPEDEQVQAGGTDETETEQESEEEPAAEPASEPERAQETVQTAETAVVPETPQNAYYFRNKERLQEHFEKHGSEFGYASAEEYLAGANRVIADSNALQKPEAEDNDTVYYLEATNELVIVSTDGYIRTYFKPEDGIEYYNKQ